MPGGWVQLQADRPDEGRAHDPGIPQDEPRA